MEPLRRRPCFGLMMLGWHVLSFGAENCKHGYPKSFVHYLRWLGQQSQHGFTLVLNEEPTLCTIAKISLVADADGLRLLTGCKGSSALKPCFLCQNLLNGHDKVQNHVHISCSDVLACKLQTEENSIHIHSHLHISCISYIFVFIYIYNYNFWEIYTNNI